MLAALDAMALSPSAIILTNGTGGGFHAYWWLEKPIKIESKQQRDELQAISNRWIAELRLLAQGKVDGTADLCRVLRPIGSTRESGNTVQALRWCPSHRYTLDQFRLAPLPQTEPERTYEPSHKKKVVEPYLIEIGEHDPAFLLERYAGYTRAGRFLTRPGSQSGAPTCELHEVSGRTGATFKSGSCEPFTALNAKGTNGKWYSTGAIYVRLVHDGIWKQAAAHCHRYFEKQRGKSEVDFENLNKDRDSEPAKKTKLVSASKLASSYLNRLQLGDLPQLYRQCDALNDFEIGPELVCVVGAPPGVGKTALSMQLMFDTLRLNKGVKAVYAATDTSFDAVFRRQLCRETRLPTRKIRFGNLDFDELAQIAEAGAELIQRLENVNVLPEPSLPSLLELLEEPPGLLIVDYIQQFAPGDKDARTAVGDVMAMLRRLSGRGWSVLAISATKRDPNGKHSSKELSLSSFRESGAIEYDADSAYVLRDNGPLDESNEYVRRVTLDCVKNRHDAKHSYELRFDMPRMEFLPYVSLADFDKWGREPASAFGGAH